MRLGKIAAAAAGSLIVGAMGLPGMMSAANAAPTTTALHGSVQCSYSTYALPYTVDTDISVDGTAVTASLGDIVATDFPTGLKMKGFKVSLVVSVDGESVTLTGENTYTDVISGVKPGDVSLPMPTVSGTRTGTGAVGAASLVSTDIKMKANFQFAAPPTTFPDNQLYCAPVAPTTALTCTFGVYKINYNVEPRVTIVSKGSGQTAIAGKVAKLSLPAFKPGMPSFVTATKAVVTTKLMIGSDLVTVVSTNDYDPAIPGDVPLTFAEATGDRGETSVNPQSVAITGVDFVITANGSDSPVSCVPAVATTASAAQAFTCAFQTFSMGYKVNAAATVKGDGVSVTLADTFHPGMPAFVPVNGITANLGVKVNDEAVALTGTTTFDPSRPGNGDFALPVVTGTRTKALDASTLTVESLALSVKSGTTDNAISCVKGAPTKTVVTAVSPSANKVTLTATVDDDTAAGTVEFKKGTAKVATATVAAGKATATLSGVAAGTHAYTATFVPADASAFGTSTSAAVSVKVANPVVVAKATTSKTTASYNKKKKTAAISTTVKAGSVSATGSVKVVVKVGKKQIASKTITLKSGKVSLTLKKASLKKKGTYTVTTTYAGNSAFKASKSTKTFKVK